MPSDVVELLVFIASPGDLPDERKALRDIETTLNATFAPVGVRVRVSGWEEVHPDLGRAQALINPGVEDCDIFIGFLKRKWGTETGEHSSGFFEEFTVAAKRREAGGSEPKVALYFGEVPKHELDDAGPDLQKVVAFRKRVEAEKLALYSTFSTPADLATKALSMISRHIVETYLRKSDFTGPSGSAGVADLEAPTSRAQIQELAPDAENENEPNQLQTMLRVVLGLVSGEIPSSPLDNDRLELLGTSLGRDHDPMGTHLVNRLYRRRNDLELILAEHTCWVRTLFNDIGTAQNPKNRVVPGWGLVNRYGDDFREMHLRLAVEDGSAVGRGAIQSLIRLGLRPAHLWPIELGGEVAVNDERPVNDEHQEAQALTDESRIGGWLLMLDNQPGLSIAVDYLLQDIDSNDSATLDALRALIVSITSDEALNDKSRNVLNAALRAMDGDMEELADALGYSDTDNAQWRLVLRNMDHLSEKLINQFARQTTNRRAKVAAVQAGIARDCLTERTRTQLLLLKDDDELTEPLIDSVDDDQKRAYELLNLLLENTKDTITPPETYARLLYLAVGTDDLQRRQGNEFSPLRWEALSYGDAEGILEEARDSLRTDAQRVREGLDTDDDSVVDYAVGRQMRAAASVLSRQTNASDDDIDLVLEKFDLTVTHTFLFPEHWRILRRVASPRTTARLVQILTNYRDGSGYGDVRNHMDHVSLAPAIAAANYTSDIEDIRERARRWYIEQPERTDAELRKALYEANAEVRIAAAMALTQRLPREDLLDLQEQYPSVPGQYWYNVIAYFDEHLYAQTEGQPAV